MKKNLLFCAVIFLAGCTRIPTGSVGIKQSFTGYIHHDAVGQGLYLSVLTSYFPVDTTLTRATVRGMQPKDAHGVALRDVSVVVTYHLEPGKVAAFYRETKELDPEPDSNMYTLGIEILERSVVPYAVQIATEQSNLADISSHLTQYATQIQAITNSRLHALYRDDPFDIVSVTVPTFTLPSAIQDQMNAKAGYQAELQTIAAQMNVAKARKAVAAEQATVDANALAMAAKKTGLSPTEIISWKRAQALAALAGGKNKPAVLVESK